MSFYVKVTLGSLPPPGPLQGGQRSGHVTLQPWNPRTLEPGVCVCVGLLDREPPIEGKVGECEVVAVVRRERERVKTHNAPVLARPSVRLSLR